MLPQINRLKKDKDFEKVFKKGKGYKENFLYLKIIPNNLKISRFGFITSKKFSPKAVLRNKIKRKLRELIRIILPQVKKNIDGVIIVMPGFRVNDFWELEGVINKLFKKTGILKKLK